MFDTDCNDDLNNRLQDYNAQGTGVHTERKETEVVSKSLADVS